MTQLTKIAAALATLALAGAAAAQTVSDDSVPDAALNIPGNVQLFGEAPSNVYRPSATVNGEIITGTDIEHRLALVKLANRNVELAGEELQRLRQQVFQNLIDEKLQIQEAIGQQDRNRRECIIDQQYARLAAQFRQTPERLCQIFDRTGQLGRRDQATDSRRICLGSPIVTQCAVANQCRRPKRLRPLSSG